ncbi:MAG: response regulator, partial [Proteobacteria bacterium]|nr:response regulator [Pseudomonadota bacterium]
ETGMLLLVDDDAAVRGTTAEMLRSAGFAVAEAADGAAALDWLRREPAISIVLTDVVMPGMNGLELAEEASRLRPGIPVLFMSGFADLAGVAGGDTIATLIRKPFRQNELIAHIARCLQEKGARAP